MLKFVKISILLLLVGALIYLGFEAKKNSDEAKALELEMKKTTEEYDASIEELNDAIVEHESKNDELSKKNRKLKSKNKELKKNLNNSEESVEKLKNEVSKLKGKVNSLSLPKEEAKENEAQDIKTNSNNVAENKKSNKSVASSYNMVATHYTADCDTCGQWKGITATGADISSSIYVNGKRVIAVDPSVIPLNSTVRVTGGGHSFEALALDTGGRIVGNKIDILVGSKSEAKSLGVKNVKVEVLN